jgi:hypothetical protein
MASAFEDLRPILQFVEVLVARKLTADKRLGHN